MILKSPKPKIAIFYDWINQWGGAEKVLLDILAIFPETPVYTLVYNPVKSSWLPQNIKVTPSIINKFPFSKNNPIIYTPFYDLALEQFDFNQYDIVISTTSTVGHCLLTNPETLFFCYFHNINRYLYYTPPKYFLLKPLLSLYKKIDRIESKRPDYYLCNSQTVAKRLQKHYHINPQIINPGVDIDFFKPINNSNNSYFLIVSRLVPHKNIDIAIKAFINLSYKLVIIGTGRYHKKLKQLANNSSNITFINNVSSSELLSYYQNCRALICPQLEDFGLVAIEAQACGKPVIAYGYGGHTETVVNRKTGLFFYHPTQKSLLKCLRKFNKLKFDPEICRNNSLKFSNRNFMLNFKKTIINLWQNHQTITS